VTDMCKRALAVAVAGGAVVFLSACAGGSEATSPSRGGADNGSTEVTNTAPSGSVEDYWTEERMRSAQPQPMPSE
jgi:ABC-type glycerol-3-phosphate transport system substrate-binding protein